MLCALRRNSVFALLKANCSVHCRVPDSSDCAGENFQPRAASSALREKYLLGPADSSVASATLPAASTSTFTRTLILPWIVLRALGETCGITRRTTPLWLSAFVVLVADCGFSAAAPCVACVDFTSIGGPGVFGLAIRKIASATSAANPSQ